MTPVRRRWSIYLLILVLAFGARVAAAAWWQARIPDGQRFTFGDSQSYWALALRVSHGESYQFGEQAQIFRTPGYPVTPLVYMVVMAAFLLSAVVYRPVDTLIGVALAATGAPVYRYLDHARRR